MQVLYSLQGARGIQDLVERATTETKAGLERACRETAHAVQGRAKQNAEAIRDRGDLINAIAVEGRGVSWRVGLVDRRIESRHTGRGKSNSAHVNPSVYGVWYELGFVTKRIQAHPYIGPAAEAELVPHELRVLRALESGLGAGGAA